MRVDGIDVSNHQGAIDWRKVRGEKVRFAYLKATEGRDYVDSTYERNRAAAKREGIKVGAYHFARPDTQSADPKDAIAEADHFIRVAKPAPGDLIPCLDLEVAAPRLEQWAEQFVRRLEQAGLPVLIYVSPAFAERHLKSKRWARHPLWLAHYGVVKPHVPRPWRRYALWQWTSGARVAGIQGRVDANQMAAASLDALTIRGKAKPRKPKPRPRPKVRPKPVDAIAGTHFSWGEALARSGYTKVPLRLRPNVVKQAKKMEQLRTALNAERAKRGLPPTGISVLSWLRSPAKNRAVGGASNSRHMKGDACDISREEIRRICPWNGGPKTFDDVANRIFAKGGIGLYPGQNRHVDSRGWFARWKTW